LNLQNVDRLEFAASSSGCKLTLGLLIAVETRSGFVVAAVEVRLLVKSLAERNLIDWLMLMGSPGQFTSLHLDSVLQLCFNSNP
jgi:hypothetical protein